MRLVVQGMVGLLLVILLPDSRCVRMVQPLQHVSVRKQKAQQQQQPLLSHIPPLKQLQQPPQRLQLNLKAGGVENRLRLNLLRVQLKPLPQLLQVLKAAVQSMEG